MLVHVDDLEADFGERFYWALRDTVAVDRTSGVWMFVSRGRRRGGRPSRYYVQAPTGDAGFDGKPRFERAFGLTAWTDDEAVTTANQRLEKWLAKGLHFDTKSYKWIPAQQEG